MFPLFRNRDFTSLFAGRLVTNAGDSIYFIAAMWLVWDLTGNEFFTGLAGTLTLAPSGVQFLFGPLVDRWPLRRVLVGTQLAQAVLVLTIPLAAVTGYLSVWVVLAVMPTLSLLNQLAYPAETAALPRIVERDELVGANSLFSLAYQGVDAVFTALAGVLVVVLGATALFVLDSVTFVVAAALFAAIAIPRASDEETVTIPEQSPDDLIDVESLATDGGPTEVAGPDADGSPDVLDDAATPSDALSVYLAELREGLDYLRGTFLVKLVGGSLVINFAIGATIAVMPSYGEHVGGPEGYGFLMAALGGGILVGALVASSVGHLPFGRLSVGAFLLSGVAWLAAVAVGWLPGTVALFALAFVPVGITNVLLISAVQAVVPETLLGRVTAVLGSVSAVATPFGSLAGGAVAATAGPVPVMAGAGVGFLVLAGYVAVVPALRGLPAIGDIDDLAVEV